MKNAVFSVSKCARNGAVLVTLICAAGFAGCGSPAATPEASSAAPAAQDTVYVPSDPRGIQTAVAELKQVSKTLELAGRIEPDPTSVIPVFPPVGGRVVRVDVRPGEAVERGQVLAELESSDVTSARVDYQHALTDAKVKEQQRQRSEDLLAKGAMAEKDAQQAEADAQMAAAEVVRTLDRLRVLGVDPVGTTNEFKLLSPRAGVILDVGASPGEFSKSLDAP